MTYTAEQLREMAAQVERGHQILGDDEILAIIRAHADALDLLASIEAAQGEDVRGAVKQASLAFNPVINASSWDASRKALFDYAIPETRKLAVLLESLSAKLAEREACTISHDDWYAMCNRAEKAEAEVARLKGRLHEIAEEWAGAECGEPVTAQEGYAIELCKRMYRIATEFKEE